MRFSINRATLVGNVGNVDMRYTQSGMPILKFGLATSRGVKNGDTWDNVTTWHTVILFSKDAERVGQWLEKGNKVLVEGRIENRSYEKDGEKKYTSEIIASEVIGFEKRGGSAPIERGSERFPAQEVDEQPIEDIPVTNTEDIDIEEIPF